MRQDVFGEALAALIAARSKGLFSSYFTFPPPKYVTGRYYSSQFMCSDALALTITATRIYYQPIFLNEVRSWQGFVFYNTGAGDSGKKVRTGLYDDNNGVPGTLIGSGAEVTLSAAAAERVATGSFSNNKVGLHWLALQSDTGPAIRRNFAQNYSLTSGGSSGLRPNAATFGAIAATDDTDAPGSAYYIDTTYAALAASAVQPTAMTNLGVWLALKA